MYAHVRIFHCIQMTQTLCCLCAEILRFKNSGPARKKQKFTFRILGNPPEVTLSENPRVSVSFLDGRRGQKPWKPSKISSAVNLRYRVLYSAILMLILHCSYHLDLSVSPVRKCCLSLVWSLVPQQGSEEPPGRWWLRLSTFSLWGQKQCRV